MQVIPENQQTILNLLSPEEAESKFIYFLKSAKTFSFRAGFAVADCVRVIGNGFDGKIIWRNDAYLGQCASQNQEHNSALNRLNDELTKRNITVLENRQCQSHKFVKNKIDYTLAHTQWGSYSLLNNYASTSSSCPSLNASFYASTRDKEGVCGGLVTSADGHPRLLNGLSPEQNIDEITMKAVTFLTDQLMQKGHPKTTKEDLISMLNLVDIHLKWHNQQGKYRTGATNLAGIRFFGHKGDSHIQVIGLNLGSQRVFITDSESGETIQLNSPAKNGEDCYIGGLDKQGYESHQIETFNQMVSIKPENAIVWIATSGAWHNLKPTSDFAIDLAFLKKFIADKAIHSPIDLTQQISLFIQKQALEIHKELSELEKQQHYQSIRSNITKLAAEIQWKKKALDYGLITAMNPYVDK